MGFTPGESLGKFEIIGLIGAGGMGEVYRARDTQLGREVAIKVLPPELAQNGERSSRLEREARLLAAVEHANIATLYGLERVDGQPVLVMQLIDGETLAERLAKGPLPVAQALALFIQIAEGLEAAHREGIVHRDLKPANIKITPNGTAVVLDFGIAKALSPTVDSGASERLTVTKGTSPGVVLGTVAYMSPEQARGEPVDKQTDAWAFGCCLYEALTGRAAFGAATVPQTLARILEGVPEWDRLPSVLPENVERLLRRCLAKDPQQRQRDLGDAALEIAEAVTSAASPLRPAARRLHLLLQLGTAGIAAALLYLWMAFHAPEPPEELGFTQPTQVSAFDGIEDHPSWSPDGTMLAYEASAGAADDWDIWLQQASGGEPLNRTKDFGRSARLPVWSPDGGRIAFWTGPSEEKRRGGAIFVMPALAGAARRVSAMDSHAYGQPQWSTDGKRLAFIVCSDPTLRECWIEIGSVATSGTGTVPETIALEGASPAYDLSWSPDGKYFAYSDGGGVNTTTQLRAVSSDGAQNVVVTDGSTNARSPVWSTDARSLYYVSNAGGAMDIWAQAMVDGMPVGEPRPLTSALEATSLVFSWSAHRMAMSRGRRIANVWRVPILEDRAATWAEAEQITFEQSLTEDVDVALDGEQLLLATDRSGNPDLWERRVSDSEPRQLTFERRGEWAGRWAPGGDAIAFHATGERSRDIWVLRLDGTAPEQLTRLDGNEYNPTWSPDGMTIAFYRRGALWSVPSSGGTPQELTNGVGHPRVDWSPNGRSLVFVSDTEPPALFRLDVANGERRKLGAGPAGAPRWSRDGDTIFYLGADEKTGKISALLFLAGRGAPLSGPSPER
jgi:Tol biopolymer transport system component